MDPNQEVRHNVLVPVFLRESASCSRVKKMRKNTSTGVLILGALLFIAQIHGLPNQNIASTLHNTKQAWLLDILF